MTSEAESCLKQPVLKLKVLKDSLLLLLFWSNFTGVKDALDAHFPIRLIASPAELEVGDVDSPIHLFLAAIHDPLTLSEMYEWLGMLFLSSPRVRKDDEIDPYLSSYYTPDFGMLNDSGHSQEANDTSVDSSEKRNTVDSTATSVTASTERHRGLAKMSMAKCRVSQLQWHGLIPAMFVEQLLFELLNLVAGKTQHWASINVSCFGGACYTILVTSGGNDCFTWRCS